MGNNPTFLEERELVAQRQLESEVLAVEFDLILVEHLREAGCKVSEPGACCAKAQVVAIMIAATRINYLISFFF